MTVDDIMEVLTSVGIQPSINPSNRFYSPDVIELNHRYGLTPIRMSPDKLDWYLYSIDEFYQFNVVMFITDVFDLQEWLVENMLTT